MSFFRAWMFNRQASAPGGRPDDVLKALNVAHGQWVADLGSGGGYFTFRFARIVGPSGKVFPVDTDPGLLGQVTGKSHKLGLANVEPLLTDGFPSGLPSGRLDLVFARNMYHHLTDRSEYFRRMRAYLAPGGRVAIIDYKDRAGRFSLHTHAGHHTTPGTIAEEMGRAGYMLKQRHDLLTTQSFQVFGPGDGTNGDGEGTDRLGHTRP